MEDEIRKSMMDCVYFLASPLTCKKGSECEYRHSETARINPRDCRYWLNGNCINPNCPFRHPPLEGLTEPVSKSAHLPPNSAVSTSKSNIPCYFYFNAYCIKGGQCPFLHDIPPAQKFSKTVPEPTTTITHPPEHKSSTGSHTGTAPVEIPENPRECTPELIKQYRAKEVQQPSHGSVTEQSSPSVESSVPSVLECDEPTIKLPDSPVPPAECGKGSSGHLSPDQSSEELVNECIEPDERWESSPGFDVLVDDSSDLLAYRDVAEYLLAHENESEMLHSHLLQFDFEGSAGYDAIGQPDAGYVYDHSGYDSHDHLENRYTPEYFHEDFEHPRGRFLNSMIHQKRKLPCREHEVDARGGVDLRNHLRKRRRTEVRRATRNSRNYRSSRTGGDSRERPTRHRIGPFPHGTLASELGKSMIGSSYSETESVPCQWRGWSEYLPSDRHYGRTRRREWEGRRRHGKLPPAPSSEISLGSDSKEANSTRVMTAGFTGPKTLAQIREEKSRAKADNYGTGSDFRRRLRRRPPMSGDFEGPKPLNELLKDKRKVSVSGNDSHLEEYSVPNYHRTAAEQDRESESNLDSDDDDDDSLRKKLAHILSR